MIKPTKELQENNFPTKIENVFDSVTDAFKDLKKIQSGEDALLKTGDEMIDSHLGGLLPGDVVILGGRSGTGKSEKLYKLINQCLDKKINPMAEEYVSLEYSMEMKMLNKTVREIHRLTGKPKSKILTEEFTEEEKKIVSDYYISLKDDRRKVVQEPVTPEEYYQMTRQFCLDNSDKKAILISSDHILLHTGSDKFKVLEKITEYTNLLKLEFKNVYFILISQLNRSSYPEVKERNNKLRPSNTWLYGSSFMEHIASYIIIVENPFRMGISEYLSVTDGRYDYLKEFYTEPNSTGKLAFKTLGNLFFFITKVRDSDNMWKDLFIEKMDLTKEQISSMELEEASKVEESKVYDIPMPTFEDEKLF